MARPRKSLADKRTHKIVVWVSAAELARYLLNAHRNGLTGPDYVRALACSTADAATGNGRAVELVLHLPARHHRRLLCRAGKAGKTLEQLVIDVALAGPLPHDAAGRFELTDAVVRCGVALQQLAAAGAPGAIPDGLGVILQKIERLLDRLLAS